MGGQLAASSGTWQEVTVIYLRREEGEYYIWEVSGLLLEGRHFFSKGPVEDGTLHMATEVHPSSEYLF